MSANVVPISDVPALTDIPARLRRLADQIETGELADVKSVLVLVPVEGDYPMAFGFGLIDDELHPIVTCELAKAFFVKAVVERT